MNAEALLLEALIESIVSGEKVPPERFGKLATGEHTRRLADDLQAIAMIAEVGRDAALPTEAGRSVRIGRFELGAALGAGGMGTVWEARDTTLERTVAIKFLHPHLAGDAKYRERFLREGRAVARLRHKGICAIYEVGETPEALSLTQRGQVLEQGEVLPSPPSSSFAGKRCRSAFDAAPGSRIARLFASQPRLPKLSRPPTKSASSTAISSRQTSCWGRTGASLSWTSVSQASILPGTSQRRLP